MKRILIISDGKPGHLNQSIAFCKIKNIDYDIKEVKFKSKFHKSLSYIFDKIGFFTETLFQNDLEVINLELYDGIISTGSGTYYFNKLLAKKYDKKSIALMLPKSYKYSDFYYIIAQEHDYPPMLNNLITIPLNLSSTASKGYIQKDETKKSLAIILGGDNAVFSMNKIAIKEKLDEIFIKYPNYLKFITTSRRTSSDIEELINEYNFDYKLIYSKEPNINPIGDFIEICDEFFITIDSTSMLSEVRANSNAKINIIDLESKKKNTKYHKLANIVANLNEKVNFKKILEKVKI
jgi:mitochondrial fission protein ELM1